MMSLIKDKIKCVNNEIIDELDKVLPIPIGPEKRVFEAMRYSSMSSGKRLRPLLVLEGASIFNIPGFQALRVATAVEMVHCYSLIHDDLPAMDDDDLRRGIPTCHKQFDEATAILAGDGLLTKAFEILANPKTHKNPEVRSKLVLELAKAAGPSGMVGGQMIDLTQATKKEATIEYISRLQSMKTGAIIKFSCMAGGIMANVDGRELSKLKKYADCIGQAFQITDDLLDAEGDPEIVGKATKKDDKAGKTTFVSTLGLDESRQRAFTLVDDAINALKTYGPKADVLREIARFIIARNK